MNSHTNISEHVGEMLSGYVDGELTQQQRQRVELHCEQCAACRDELASVEMVRTQVRGSALSPLGEDVWREHSLDAPTNALSRLGWILILIGLIAGGGIGIWHFVQDNSISLWARIGIGGVYLGAAFLLLSVTRQRWLERKTDKYKDVEI
ncbi:MAG: anti-sigma factor [Gammaproteobacteria bacterium]